MNASQLTDKELIQKSKYLVGKVNERIETKVGAENAPTYVIKKLENLKELTTGRMAGKYTRQELEDIYRDARYLDNLKVTTEKYALVGKKIQDISRAGGEDSPLEKNIQNRAWEAYRDLVQDNGFLIQFKYDILNVATEMLEQDLNGKHHTKEYIYQKIKHIYDKAYNKYANDRGQLDISFTEGLDELLRKIQSNTK